MNIANRIVLCMAISLCFATLVFSKDDEVQNYLLYREAVGRTANMVSDREAVTLAHRQQLHILNVTWEDTGRYKGSSVGPNISDVTIQVQLMDPRNETFQLTCMPVIRYPNFSDLTADLSPNDFYVLVGNEKGQTLRQITLTEYLDNFRNYLSKPASWKGDGQSLLAPRDTQVLVSAQACFLPVPKGKKAEFNTVIFNYQSCQKDPAVLCILATREGTSATIIDNQRDAFPAGATWGQRLFFNQNGQRASLTGQRLSDFQAEQKDTKGDQPSVGANKEKGLNMVLLIQVPLKQKQPMVFKEEAVSQSVMYESKKKSMRRSDVEEAVIGHGRLEGKFTEIDNLAIERDDKFPIRVTVQFYKATSNGIVSENDMTEIKTQIHRVYKNASYVGSLVLEGRTNRPTEYDGPKFEPPQWWSVFWQRHYNNTGEDREQAIAKLQKLYGAHWIRMTREESKFGEAVELAYKNAGAPISSKQKASGGKNNSSIFGNTLPPASGQKSHPPTTIPKHTSLYMYLTIALIGGIAILLWITKK